MSQGSSWSPWATCCCYGAAGTGPYSIWRAGGEAKGPPAPTRATCLWHLQVSTAEVADAASYVCVAQNQAGSAEKVFTLRVQGERLHRWPLPVLCPSRGDLWDLLSEFRDPSLTPAVSWSRERLRTLVPAGPSPDGPEQLSGSGGWLFLA